MSKIQTLLGAIEAEQIGPTNVHDHIYRDCGKQVDLDDDFRIDNLEKSALELQAFYDAGGRCMVDAEPLGSRNALALVEIARRVPVHVIATTGFHKSSLYFNDFWGRHYSLDEIVPLLVAEVEEGMELRSYGGPLIRRSTAKAGVVKCGVSYQVIKPLEERWARAAARTHLATGVPIITHTDKGTMALQLIDILASEGVDPQHVVIGHIDRNPDLGYHMEIARTGAFLQYDGASRAKYYPDNTIIGLIFGMVEQGYGKQIVLAGDNGQASYLRSYGGGPGYVYILETFVPRLRREGLDESVIQDLLVHNPRRALSFVPAAGEVTP